MKFSYKKAIQSINLFAELEGGRINYMKAIKLIWLSDRYHLRNHGRTITGDEYFALKNGPVASCTLDIIKSTILSDEETIYKNLFLIKSNSYILKSIKPFDSKVFSNNELRVLNLIYSEYKVFDEFQLSDISHEFPEWKEYEEKIKKSNSSYKIDMDLFFINYEDDKKLFVNTVEEITNIKEYQKMFYPILS
jgi:uncharacterized phage-associated protein